MQQAESSHSPNTGGMASGKLEEASTRRGMLGVLGAALALPVAGIVGSVQATPADGPTLPDVKKVIRQRIALLGEYPKTADPSLPENERGLIGAERLLWTYEAFLICHEELGL